MKYFGYMPNDFINGVGVCVSLWTAGCPHRCVGCHNSHMWNYEDGYNVPNDLVEQLVKALDANGISRNLSILGGEPMSVENREMVNNLIWQIKALRPNTKIYLWTGYTLEELKAFDNVFIDEILSNIHILIDGRYIESERDITLPLRGSKNQRIINMEDIND